MHLTMHSIGGPCKVPIGPFGPACSPVPVLLLCAGSSLCAGSPAAQCFPSLPQSRNPPNWNTCQPCLGPSVRDASTGKLCFQAAVQVTCMRGQGGQGRRLLGQRLATGAGQRQGLTGDIRRTLTQGCPAAAMPQIGTPLARSVAPPPAGATCAQRAARTPWGRNWWSARRSSAAVRIQSAWSVYSLPGVVEAVPIFTASSPCLPDIVLVPRAA